MATATLLLPAARRLGAPSAGVAAALGRADAVGGLGDGRRAQLRRHVRLVPDHWPVAALTRQLDAGDAAGASWLRADPCRIQPDINGARLLDHGDTLGLDADDVAQLLPALKPLFGDAGMPIDAPVPSRWYLRLAPSTPLPTFAEPDDALGDDVFEHLAEGSEGRRWRVLLTEAQVVLHNHPWNQRRMESGRRPVNSLWFWGGGRLPDQVQSPRTRFHGGDELAAALATLAGNAAALPARFEAGEGDVLFDLSTLRDGEVLERAWLQPALASLSAGSIDALVLDTADGATFTLRRRQRWRVWRRPRPDFQG
ncbi:phosphoglycerate mutase [Luteimonas sp. SDU101]|uniref:phosphoglycerate mutase n=1 Tax=unclassified Luteimonas TaxID=2629088 RepID=UPI003EBD5F22